MPFEIERKYLIRLQADESGMMRRVRKRGSDVKGWQYTYTRKQNAGFGKRIELEDEITEAQYLALLEEAEPSMQTVHKVRWCFLYEKQFFELDVYAFSDVLATLEIELPDIDTPVTLPPEIELLADVTGDGRFSNSALSKTLTFPKMT